MATPAQINANRLNALKSTGPRTDEGKASSRLNALQHGVDAKLEVIPGEDPAELEALRGNYYDAYQPAGPALEFLVETLIQADWNRRRFRRIEAELINHAAAEMESCDHPLGALFAGNTPAARAIERVMRHYETACRAWSQALAQLQKFRQNAVENAMVAMMAGAADPPPRVPQPQPDAAKPAPAPGPRPFVRDSPGPAPTEIGFVPPVALDPAKPAPAPGPRPPPATSPCACEGRPRRYNRPIMLHDSRRRFLAFFSGSAAGASLLPGVLWSQLQQSGADRVTDDMLKGALAVSGLSFSDEERKAMLQGVNRTLSNYEELRRLQIPVNVGPPLYFSALTPGMKVNRTREPLRFSAPTVKRPANLEDVAYWPVTHLAALLKSRRVTSVELTEMYLARLHKHNEKLNCVVTFLDDYALAQARQADSEIAAGKHRGPLHGIPWGAKDIIAVKGFKTTWGSDAYKDQVLDEEASVVEMLRDAGAVLLAKLASGELAQGDRWFGGQTKNPWNIEEGSSGSSAGPGAATAAGLVGFAIGTETSGSILSPSARCGVTGLRPTFGRISRYGVMALAWTQDRLGPMCRYAEDCAVVMAAIAKPDNRDLSVSEIPFNWNAHLDVRKLRVGYIKDAFDETRDPVAKAADEKTLAAVEALGVKLVPITIPEWTLDVSPYAVESAAFFDELIRTGGDKKMTTPTRAAGWKSARVIPAVEFIQLQRARMMLMMKLAEATADVDVYLTPGMGGGGFGGGGGRGGRGATTATDGAATTPPAAPPAGRGGADAFRRSPTQRHFTMANSACYPALNIPNGFRETGSPTSVTFMARPFGEPELLALGKAYQDAAGFHLKKPNLT